VTRKASKWKDKRLADLEEKLEKERKGHKGFFPKYTPRG
jgi:hypothetical protein